MRLIAGCFADLTSVVRKGFRSETKDNKKKFTGLKESIVQTGIGSKRL